MTIHPRATDLPPSCAVAFKEWEGICSALLSGRQSLILRKGGIDEAAGEFRPEHTSFWLYPTRVHQEQQGLKPRECASPGNGEDECDQSVRLRGLAVVAFLGRVVDAGRLAMIDDMHIWTEDTVKKRFHYRTHGLWVLGVRIYRRDEPYLLPVTAEHAGCRSWVPCGIELSTRGLVPVLDDEEFDDRRKRLSAAIGTTDRGDARQEES
jgi:hypothetical protein